MPRGVPSGLAWRFQAWLPFFVLGQGRVGGQSGERVAGSGEVDIAGRLIGGRIRKYSTQVRGGALFRRGWGSFGVEKGLEGSEGW